MDGHYPRPTVVQPIAAARPVVAGTAVGLRGNDIAHVNYVTV